MRAACLDLQTAREVVNIGIFRRGIFRFIRSIALQKGRLRL